MYIIGIACYGSHDSSIALIKDGQVIAAVEEERFTRVKHDRSFPFQGIQYCLDKANIQINGVEHIGYFFQPLRALGFSLRYALTNYKNLNSIIFGKQDNKNESRAFRFSEMLRVKSILRKKLGYKNQFHFMNHHLCHAASSYYTSGFDKAAILTLDGVGEAASVFYGKALNNNIVPIKTINFPQSLGFMYGSITQYLGYQYNSDEYKVMGLAPYSDGSLDKEFQKMAHYKGSGQYELDLSYFNFQYGKTKWYSHKMENIFGPAREHDDEIKQHHSNIAGAAQRLLETIVLQVRQLYRHLKWLRCLHWHF